VALLAPIVYPIESIWALHTVRLVHEVGLRASTVRAIPDKRISTDTLVLLGVPVSWCRTWDAVVSVHSSWALTCDSIPDGFRGGAHTLVSRIVPSSGSWAWNTVISKETILTGTSASCPFCLGSRAYTLVLSNVPSSWFWAWLTFGSKEALRALALVGLIVPDSLGSWAVASVGVVVPLSGGGT
jgi:hypothetical protein